MQTETGHLSPGYLPLHENYYRGHMPTGYGRVFCYKVREIVPLRTGRY